MSAAVPTPTERARKSHLTLLRALQEPGRQMALATAMGVSESTISRLKNEHAEAFCAMAAHLGFKLVPSEHRCVNPETFAAFELLFAKAMSLTSPGRLVFEDGD